eukprot:4029672-Alexandrium_andersonii.AAC.1
MTHHQARPPLARRHPEVRTQRLEVLRARLRENLRAGSVVGPHVPSGRAARRFGKALGRQVSGGVHRVQQVVHEL